LFFIGSEPAFSLMGGHLALFSSIQHENLKDFRNACIPPVTQFETLK